MGDRNALRDRVLALRILDETLCQTIRTKITNLEEREAAIATAKLQQQRRQLQQQQQQQRQQQNQTNHGGVGGPHGGSYGSHHHHHHHSSISFQSSNYRYSNPSSTTAGGTETKILDLEGVSCVPAAQSSSSSTSFSHHRTISCLDSDSDSTSALPDPTLWTFHCDDQSYPARLSNLPCPVELHKTRDRKLYHKSTNIAQILTVYSSRKAMKEAETERYPRSLGFVSYHPSGLTPPMGKVVENRYAKREHACVPPPREEIMEVEKELMELIKRVNKDGGGKKNASSKSGSGGGGGTVIEIEDEVVQYEPWMDNDGTGIGVEFTEDDELCLQHPELWLDPDEMGGDDDEEEEGKDKKKKKNEEEENDLFFLSGSLTEETKKSKKKSKNSSSSSSSPGGGGGKKKNNKKKKNSGSSSSKNQTTSAKSSPQQPQTDYAQQIAQDMLQNKDDEIDLDFFDFDNEDDFLGGDGALGL